MSIIHRARVFRERRKLTAIRREIARKIIIACGPDALVDLDPAQSSDQMLASLRYGGVFCSGAALILWRALLERGYKAAIGHFGFHPDGITHSGVLVELDGRRYYYDPYFNFEFKHSFDEALTRYKLTGRLPLIDDGHEPRIIYMASQLDDADWWSLDGVRADRFPCMVLGRFDVTGFEKNWIAAGGLSELTDRGLAKRIESIFLFPFAVTEAKIGYRMLRGSECLPRYTH